MCLPKRAKADAQANETTLPGIPGTLCDMGKRSFPQIGTQNAAEGAEFLRK